MKGLFQDEFSSNVNQYNYLQMHNNLVRVSRKRVKREAHAFVGLQYLTTTLYVMHKRSRVAFTRIVIYFYVDTPSALCDILVH